jgi:Tol biopolymer transport system component
LWELSYPGGEARRITNDLNLYLSASVTADGSGLLALQASFTSNLYVVSSAEAANPASVRQITETGTRTDGFTGLAWLPGQKLVYGYYGTGQLSLATVSATGGASNDLSLGSSFEEGPIVCGDGQIIVYTASHEETASLWRVDASGTNPRNLTAGLRDAYPACASDDRTVFFTSDASNLDEHRLNKISLDGGASVVLSKEILGLAAISPDHRWLAALYRTGVDQPHMLAIVDAADGTLHASYDLPPGFGLAGEGAIPFAWLPDGRSIVYAVQDGDVSNLLVRRVDLSNPGAKPPPTPLTHFASGLIFSFAWSPDGKQLALARGRVATDAVLISHFH